jgi:hypothetical protein
VLLFATLTAAFASGGLYLTDEALPQVADPLGEVDARFADTDGDGQGEVHFIYTSAIVDVFYSHSYLWSDLHTSMATWGQTALGWTRLTGDYSVLQMLPGVVPANVAGALDLDGDGIPTWYDVVPDILDVPWSCHSVRGDRVFAGTHCGSGTIRRLLAPVDVDGDGDREALLDTTEGVYALDPANRYYQASLYLWEQPDSRAAASGDINGDGWIDLAVLRTSSPALEIYLGSANGLTSALSMPGSWTSLVVGDITGDGLAEVIAGDPLGRVEVWIGGAVRLTGPAALAAPTNGAGVGTTLGLGDLDGDGVDDVLATDADARGLFVWPSTIDPRTYVATWFPHVPDRYFLWRDGPRAADIDGDGREEVFDSSGPRTVIRYAPDTQDHDRDGSPALGDCDDHNPLRSPLRVEAPGDSIDNDCDQQELCFGDADHDGARTATTIARPIPFNPGTFQCATWGYAGREAPVDCDDAERGRSPFRTDLPGDGVDNDCDRLDSCWVDTDGDGPADTVAPRADCTADDVRPRPGTARTFHPGADRVGAVHAAGDVNDDGLADVLVIQPDRVLELYLGTPAGLDAAPAWTRTMAVAEQPAVPGQDVNGDGIDDLTTLTATYAYVWYGRAGAAPAVAASRWTPLAFAGFNPGQDRGYTAGDLDGDGRGDLVLSRPYNSTADSKLLLGSPTGYVAFGPGPSGNPVSAAGDLDGDGRDELVWTEWTTGRLLTAGLLGAALGPVTDRGLAPCGSTTPFPTLTEPAGDLYGDGTRQLLVDSLSACVGFGLFGAGSSGVDLYGQLLHPRAAADLDGDGTDDLIAIVASDTSSPDGQTPTHAAWLAGGARLQHLLPLPATAELSSLQGDLDGDGWVDLALLDAGSWRTIGAEELLVDCAPSSPEFIGPPSPELGWCAVYTTCRADRDGDGFASAMELPVIGRCEGPFLPLDAPAGDCDDQDASHYPGAPDPWDGLDADCDGGEGLVLSSDGDLTSGQLETFTLAGAPPGATVILLVSASGPGEGPCSASYGTCADLLGPRVVTTTQVDADGGGAVQLPVPALPPGMRRWLQAIVRDGPRSGVVEVVVR